MMKGREVHVTWANVVPTIMLVLMGLATTGWALSLLIHHWVWGSWLIILFVVATAATLLAILFFIGMLEILIGDVEYLLLQRRYKG